MFKWVLESLYINNLLTTLNLKFLPSSQYSSLPLKFYCCTFTKICCLYVNLLIRYIPQYLTEFNLELYYYLMLIEGNYLFLI